MKEEVCQNSVLISTTTGMHASLKRQRLESIDRSSNLYPESCMDEANDSETFVFGDPSTTDVFLHLQRDKCSLSEEENKSEDVTEDIAEVRVHVHVLKQCRYFDALFSDRWQDQPRTSTQEGRRASKFIHINLSVASGRSVSSYIATLKLMYTHDFDGTICDVESALSILPVAAELLYDHCISVCVRFLEAVAWSREEERQIVHLVSYLQLEESSALLARLSPVKETAVVDMFNGLVYAATHNHQNGASVKAFVAQFLSGHASRDTLRQVLDKAFALSLKTVKDSVEEYASPNVRGRHDEIEALQRQNLHTAVVKGKHLFWIVERMIELKVAETAVVEWSEQGAFAANLKRAFSDDTWKNIAPGLSSLVLRCTCRLASAVACGSIIASQQVRLKLVKDWLPVLVVSRNVSRDNQLSAVQNKQLHQELEDVFLKIILTLPMSESQKLLQQCLSFATQNLEDCPHLVNAFNAWFRRANRPLAMEKGEVESEGC